MSEAQAIFAAGCFWGVEERFLSTPGVLDTQVGYSGGGKEDPTYQEVCTGSTGHAEVVEVRYDPDQVSFDQLLLVFWTGHDPTQLNRQGPDVGTQYRSAIFYLTSEQKDLATKSKAMVEAKLSKKLATEITPAGPFYPAEEYHQNYIRKGRGSCH